MSALIELARHLRATIENLATTLDDSAALDNVALFAAWSGDGVEYAVDDRVRYEDELYKVLIAHTSQYGWNPVDSPSLFAKVLIPDPDVIPVWEQPDSVNGYSIGDKVYYPTAQDDIYISLLDNNVWPPTESVAWRLYIEPNDENNEEDPEIESNDPEPEPEPEEDEDEIPEWVTPTSTEFYNTGDLVHFRTLADPVYECLIDNCTWSPEELPSAWRLVDEQ